MKTQFRSRHEILEHLEKGKEVGMYRDCAWLEVDDHLGDLFRPGCKKQALVPLGRGSRQVLGRGEYPLYVDARLEGG